MTGAFLFLTWRSFRNRLFSQIRRLKRPRYLISAIIGASYFYFVAGRHWVSGMSHAARPDMPAPPLLVEIGASLLVLGGVVLAWCASTPESPLTFSEAEVQYLFPAPVTRRSLVRWKMLRGQIGVIFSLLIFAAVSGPWLAGGSRLRFLAGAWIVFATMQLHMMGIRMARHALQRRGIGWGIRTAITIALTVGLIAIGAVWAARSVGPPPVEAVRRLAGPGGLADYAGRLFGTGPAWLITMPARLLVRPALAPDPAGFLMAAPAALAMLVLNYFWVLREGIVLEEGALKAARRLEETRQAQARGRLGRPPKVRAAAAPFRLAPDGRPEVALLWKNLIGSLRNIGGLRTLLWLLAVFLLPALVSTVARGRSLETFAPILGTMCAVTAMVLLLVGPSMLRSDFRMDLPNIDLLKSYPLSGRSLLLGTLMAPVLVLTLIQWALLAAFALLSSGSLQDPLSLKVAPAILALTGALLAPVLNMVGALIHNAALLMVPGWVAFGPVRTTGIERMGQGMLTTLGFLLAMAVSFVPAALLFGITWFFLSAFTGAALAVPLSALPAALVLAAESWAGAALLGAFLDRFDPSRELDSLLRP